MKQHIFRENDIRGVVGEDLTAENVEILALAIGTYFRRRKIRRVSLGFDARKSSLIFRDLFAANLNRAGIDVLDIGMVATPLLYFTLFTENVGGGVMITGSHNPAAYNGFKICLGKSTIHGAQIQEIRKIAESGIFALGAGGATEKKDAAAGYIDFAAAGIELGARKLKIVADGGSGTGGIIAAPLYRRLGAEVIELYTTPDGNFPHHHPDPTVSENMRDAVGAALDAEADLTIAFDGDGDRIGVADERGQIIRGDELLTIFSRAILEKQTGASIIGEIKCSQTLFDDIEKHGGRAIMWKAGHSLIKEKMRATGALLAGEMSGHFFFADRFFGFDDAIYAGARLLEILSKSEKKLSEYLEDLPRRVSTPEIRLECADEHKFEIVRKSAEFFKKTNRVIEIDGARILFEGGWGLVRASNTQPVLTLRFEAADQQSLENIQNAVETQIYKLRAEL